MLLFIILMAIIGGLTIPIVCHIAATVGSSHWWYRLHTWEKIERIVEFIALIFLWSFLWSEICGRIVLPSFS